MATGWMVRVQFLVGTIDSSLVQSIQASSETNPASYPMGNRITFFGGKVGRKGNRPLSDNFNFKIQLDINMHVPHFIYIFINTGNSRSNMHATPTVRV
jgi:hypothetical protein